jgi:transposase
LEDSIEAGGKEASVASAIETTHYVCQQAKLKEKQRHQVEHIRAGHRDLDTAYQLSQAFVLMLAERRGTDLDAWLAQAKHSGIAELKSFAQGLLFSVE